MSFATLYQPRSGLPGRQGRDGISGLNFFTSSVINDDIGVNNETLLDLNNYNFYKKGVINTIPDRPKNNFYNNSDKVTITNYNELFTTTQVYGRIFDITDTIDIGATVFNVTEPIKITSSNGLGIILSNNASSAINISSESVLIEGISMNNSAMSSIAGVINFSNTNAYNNQVINCSINTNEVGIQSSNSRIYISGNTFIHLPPYNSHRFIRILKNTDVSIIKNNNIIGYDSTFFIDIYPTTVNNYDNGVLYVDNNKSIEYVQGVGITYDSISRFISNEFPLNSNSNFSLVVTNNICTVSNVFILFNLQPFFNGFGNIILSGNTAYLHSGSTTTPSNITRGGKGLISLGNIAAGRTYTTIMPKISSYNNDYNKQLRTDWQDLTLESNSVIAIQQFPAGTTFNINKIRIENNWVNTFINLNSNKCTNLSYTSPTNVILDTSINNNIACLGQTNITFILGTNNNNIEYNVYKINFSGSISLTVNGTVSNPISINNISRNSTTTYSDIIPNGNRGTMNIYNNGINSYIIHAEENVYI